MTPKRIKPILGAVALVLALASTQAQTNNSPLEDWIKKSKNPAPWVSWGGDLRLRNEYFNNAVTLTQSQPGLSDRHEQNYQRFRARVWTALTYKDASINARMTVEPREYDKLSFHGTAVSGWDWTEGIIDNLNFRWTNIANLPLSMTIGRQDMMIGEPMNWWLICDGTPGDGSRTFYYDAARFTYTMPDIKTTLEAVWIEQDGHNDGWLPPINYLEKTQTDQRERGIIVYLSNKSLPKTTVDGYFIYKKDDRLTRYPLAATGNDGEIYTTGGRVSGELGDHFKYYVEGAYQFGSKNYQSMDAIGANSRFSYLFKDPMNSQIRFSYEYASGDDPNTRGENEQFDLLWGRWPRWSELYIYSYLKESRIAECSNLQRMGPGLSFTPCKGLDFSADYYLLFADANNRNAGTATANARTSGLFGNGDCRGQFVQTVLKYKFNSHVSAHLWAEFLFPGDYYASSDMMSFLRAELYLTY